MARINVIPPEYLTDQHLIAEHREINLAVAMIRRITNKDIPKEFTLNKGHVKYFSNKVAYLKQRYKDVGKEMKAQGSKSYTPQQKDYDIIIERITLKIKLRPNWYRYKGKPINDKDYIKMLGKVKFN